MESLQEIVNKVPTLMKQKLLCNLDCIKKDDTKNN